MVDKVPSRQQLPAEPYSWRSNAAEQQINLDNVAMKNGSIRIPKHRWKADNIRAAVEKIASDPDYRDNILKLRKSLLNTDGKANSGKTVWDFINARLY